MKSTYHNSLYTFLKQNDTKPSFSYLQNPNRVVRSERISETVVKYKGKKA